ncbi:MAG: hypothetical protein HF314_02420 [Ignavibacteria bacterium]|nr:hypothetical protein [Ignavibacteria bacterium]MCU7501901.1 hypothetical protein [Ignavibacteria bacterium]MCU7514753.1 hypothetical protein [Ignavibacteria bacterium]
MMKSIPQDKAAFSLRYLHPYFKENSSSEMSTFSGIYELEATIPVTDKIYLNFQLPFVGYSSKSGWDETTESSIGNIYLGIQAKNVTSDIHTNYFSAGLYLPTASEKHDGVTILGAFADYPSLSKYAVNIFSFYGNFASQWNFPSGAGIAFDLGPTILVPTEDNGSEDTEVMLHYGITGKYSFNHFFGAAEVNGSYILTESELDFADKIFNNVSLGAGWSGSYVTPSLFYQWNINKQLSNIVTGAFGVKLEVVLP